MKLCFLLIPKPKTHSLLLEKLRFDSAWIPEENIYLYSDHRDKFKLEKRIPKGFKEALEAIEDELKEKPFIVRKHD